MIYRNFIKLIPFITVVLIIIGCGEASKKKGYRPLVVTPSEMIADAASEIGGEFIVLNKISGKNTPHNSYPPSAKEIVATASSDIAFFNGISSSERLPKLLQQQNVATWKLYPVFVSSGIGEENFISAENGYNPHYWLDANLWGKAVSFITDNLVRVSPDNERIYRRNEEQILVKLAGLDNYISEQAKKIPENKRMIVTGHDSFEYFAKRYGFTNFYLTKFTDTDRVSALDLARLENHIRTNNIKTIFLEHSYSPRNIEIVKNDLISRGYDVKIGGVLYSQTSDNKTYAEIMIHNIDTLVKALMEENL